LPEEIAIERLDCSRLRVADFASKKAGSVVAVKGGSRVKGKSGDQLCVLPQHEEE
jgi:hypothetical protein